MPASRTRARCDALQRRSDPRSRFAHRVCRRETCSGRCSTLNAGLQRSTPASRAFDNSDLAARIASYELAYKMQATRPRRSTCPQEDEKTKEMYGLMKRSTAIFGRKCLLARRLVERGVRFVQIYSGGNHNDANWDAHTATFEVNHNLHAGEHRQADRRICWPTSSSRGMLDETLVVWGGEFGRQPTAEYAKGNRPRPQQPTASPCGWPAAASTCRTSTTASTRSSSASKAPSPSWTSSRSTFPPTQRLAWLVIRRASNLVPNYTRKTLSPRGRGWLAPASRVRGPFSQPEPRGAARL